MKFHLNKYTTLTNILYLYSSKSIFISTILFSSIFILQCKIDKSHESVDPAFTGYITAFTSGILSNQATIKIRLAESHKDAIQNQEVGKEIFQFNPTIEGTSYWVDDKTIEFMPDNPLPSGKVYDAKFQLSKLVKVPSNFKVLNFQFQVLKQSIKVNFEGIESLHPNDLSWQRMKGVVFSYDFAFGEDLESSVSAFQNGQQLKMDWYHDQNGKNHKFTIDSIHRTESKGQVILKWNGENLGFDESSEQVFEILPLGEFKLLDIQINQQPEQYVTLYFSDPIHSQQDLEGLLYIQGIAEPRLVQNENTIRLYPTSRLKGSMNLVVNEGIKNVNGYQLQESTEKEINFTGLKPAIELIGQGVILPNTNGLIFPFKAVNLKAVNIKIIRIFENNIAQFFQVNQFDGKTGMKRVGRIIYNHEFVLKSDKPIDYGNWNAYSVDLSEMIAAEPGAIYRVHLSFKQHQSLYPCNEISDHIDNQDPHESNSEDESFDEPSSYWAYYDDNQFNYKNYNYQEQENPCKPSYYMVESRMQARNLFASNLGIIAKAALNNKMVVAVTDLRTTAPLSAVNIEMYNFQHQFISSGKTNDEGFLEIDLNNKPFLLIATKDQQIAYMRLDDGTALSLSMFDIGGQKSQEGLKGYIYGERSVWRPGDSMFISFILDDKNNHLPKNHPVSFELYTPHQQLYERKVSTTGLNNFYDFRTATDQEAPTGNWRAEIKLGGTTFSKSLKIESIKPNRLKINMDFQTPLLKSSEKISGSLEVKWLHGAIASGLKADIELNLTKGSTAFNNFEGYVFDDPSKEFKSEGRIIFEGHLDENGKANIQPNIQIKKDAPGMLQAHFKIRAFEKSGDFSVDRFSVPYSPYHEYVGLKIPVGEGWNGALNSDKPNLIPIVTLDENGNLKDRKGIKIEIYDVYWRWWWESADENDLARYVTNRNENLIQTATINTINGKAIFELNLDGNYYGRKFIRVTDPVSGHSAGHTFYTTYSGWSNNSGDNPGGAEMLSFSTDRKSYKVGETIQVSIPGAKQGRALVSIETGTKVINTFWRNMTEGENKFSIPSTSEMTPNVYIHLSLIQPHNNVKNDLPIRLYGVQSVTIENPEAKLSPVISMPDVLTPEAKFNIKVKESNGRKMTYTLAIVDEGLLDLTRFQTPDPLSHFNVKEALSIRTWDMYKYVIGAFSGEMAGLLALGGDEFIISNPGSKANRFKPVVKYLGPFELSPRGENTHQITMPNYVGSVRTMVVAGNDSAYGSTEKTTPVKKPLMVLASLPRVLGPGESLELPVAVFAMDQKIKNVSVSVKSNDLIKLEGQTTKKIAFPKEGDETITFNLRVADELGIGEVEVFAKSGQEEASYQLEIDVRAANPKITDIIDAVIEPNESWESDYTPVGMMGTNNGIAEISTIPALKLQERLQYLLEYPHGCIEQTTSAVFPQLFLENFIELSDDEKSTAEENIKTAINKLRTFQIYSGGLSYWPGEQNIASDWGTNYAGHFMLEAKEKGYSLPPGFLNNWIKFQKQRANSWTADMESHGSSPNNQLVQAYRLYTLALAKTPAMGAMNRLRTSQNLSLAARWRLSAAYYLAGNKSAAEKLIDQQSSDIKPYRELSYTYGSAERDRAMILETLALLGRKKDAKIIFDELAEGMASSKWYSTQTTAYSLLAIARFIGADEELDKSTKYTYSLNGEKNNKVSVQSPITQIDLKIKDLKKGQIKIENTGERTLFVKLQMEGIPKAGDQTNAENSLNMSVRYLGLNETVIDPSSLEQGTDFIAEVQITHPGLRDDYKEMALTQIFPSGWEIRNYRMDGIPNSKSVDLPSYQDMRDDRVLTYFDVDRGMKKTFRILLNASYLGEYYLPTVYCEAMYDNEINARRAGKWIKVIKPGSSNSDGQ